MGEEVAYPSFLSLVRALPQPTILDLEQYFPGQRFWKLAFIEQYIVEKAMVDEVQEKGWQEIELYEQSPLFLRLTSQLNLVLALIRKERRKKTTLSFWARVSDIEQTNRFPVVLTYNPSWMRNSSTGTGIEQEIVIGTHGIIIENDQVLCYDLNQLGEEGLVCWQHIAAGLRPLPLQDAHAFEETIRTNNILYVRAQQAAHRLSELYWLFHTQKKEHTTNSTVRSLPSSPSALKHGGMVIPQLDPIEGVLVALSHAPKEGGGWQEIEAIPTYIHQRPTSTTEVTVRPLNTQRIPNDITKQLWQQVRQFNDVDGDILLVMLAQYLGTPQVGTGGVWITTQQILEYRDIQQKIHQRKNVQKGDLPYRQAGYRPEEMKEIEEGVKRIRDTHITVHTWKESHKKAKTTTSTGVSTNKPSRTRMYTHESYLINITDFIQQSQRFLEEEMPTAHEGLAVAWYFRPGNSLLAFLNGPNYRAAWLLQQALRYDPYHERWEKRLARYCTFQMRMNAEFGGTTIKRSIGTLIDELALSLNTTHPSKVRTRFERAMNRLEQDGIISNWGPPSQYEQAIQQLPRYNWLEKWLAYEIEITADPLPQEFVQPLREHLQEQRKRQRSIAQKKRGYDRSQP